VWIEPVQAGQNRKRRDVFKETENLTASLFVVGRPVTERMAIHGKRKDGICATTGFLGCGTEDATERAPKGPFV
jgi:hypothetical protein